MSPVRRWRSTSTPPLRCSEDCSADDGARRHFKRYGQQTLCEGTTMPPGPLTMEDLRAAVADGSIDTVVLAIVDVQGRLQGKRFDAEFFLDEVAAHGTEGCNYLLAVDIEMNTVGGYTMSSWERGYGDFAIHPDFATMRRVPWQPGTALLLGDARWLHGTPVDVSARPVLRQQLERLAERGWQAMVGTELEFIVFDDSFQAGGSHRDPALPPPNH